MHNHLALTGGWDNNLILWDLNQGKQEQVFTGHTEGKTVVRWHVGISISQDTSLYNDLPGISDLYETCD